MLIVKIDELLKKKNKTRYWLSKEIGMGYSNLMNLANGNTSSVKFNILEKICNKLDCKPGDLLVLKNEED